MQRIVQWENRINYLNCPNGPVKVLLDGQNSSPFSLNFSRTTDSMYVLTQDSLRKSESCTELWFYRYAKSHIRCQENEYINKPVWSGFSRINRFRVLKRLCVPFGNLSLLYVRPVTKFWSLMSCFSIINCSNSRYTYSLVWPFRLFKMKFLQ